MPTNNIDSRVNAKVNELNKICGECDAQSKIVDET